VVHERMRKTAEDILQGAFFWTAFRQVKTG